MKTNLLPSWLVVAALSIVLAGCSTPTKPSTTPIISPASVRPTDKPPFSAYFDGLMPWGPSKTYQQTQRVFEKLCKRGDLITRESASEAAELIDRALTQPDLKPDERAALNAQKAQAREAFRFYDLIQTTYDRFGPSIKSNEPYKQEEGLISYEASYRSALPTFTRPGYITAIEGHTTEVRRQLTEVSRTIRALEREYSDSKVDAQNNFVQTAARLDIQQARSHYHAGQGFWNDNEWEISKGLPLVQRVVSTPRVHTSLRNEAEGVKRMIWDELGRTDIDRALSTRLPAYEDEANYPGRSETAKRAYVRQQWNRDKAPGMELTKK